jgi:hypothetical protein
MSDAEAIREMAQLLTGSPNDYDAAPERFIIGRRKASFGSVWRGRRTRHARRVRSPDDLSDARVMRQKRTLSK